MDMAADVILIISAPAVPRDVLLEAQNWLALELNERGPVDEAVVEDLPDAKGPIEVVGQLGLALLSPLVVKYIAQVIVEFVKRNPQYIVKINGIEISRDRVS